MKKLKIKFKTKANISHIVILLSIALIFNGRSCFESHLPERLISDKEPVCLPQKRKVTSIITPPNRTSTNRTYNSDTTDNHDISSKESKYISDRKDQGNSGSGDIESFVDQVNNQVSNTILQQAQTAPVISYDQLIQIIDNSYINEAQKNKIKGLLENKLSICAAAPPDPGEADSSFFTLLNQFDNDVEYLLNTMEHEISQPIDQPDVILEEVVPQEHQVYGDSVREYVAGVPSREELEKLLGGPNNIFPEKFTKEKRERILTYFHEKDPYNNPDAFRAIFSDYFPNRQEVMNGLERINARLEKEEADEKVEVNKMKRAVALLMEETACALENKEDNQADIDSMCTICLDKGGRPLKCNHYFHVDCVVGHLVKNLSCPNCREQVNLEPYKT